MGNDKSKQNIVIGIGGISRSGKSSLAKQLSDHYSCPLISNDSYLVNGVIEYDPTIFPDKFRHWETTICGYLKGFYQDLLKLVLEPNSAGIVVTEGHLLYNRKDVVNLLDIKIMRIMTKEGAYKRLKELRPKLIKSEKWYDKIMWDQFILQNELFSDKLPDSYSISGELDPELVFKQVIEIIERRKAIRTPNSMLMSIKEIPVTKVTGKKECVACYELTAENTHNEEIIYRHSCGHEFHKKCFRKLVEKCVNSRKGPLNCPRCKMEIAEPFIQRLGELHNYVRATESEDTCLKCKGCGEIYWVIKGYNVVSFLCPNIADCGIINDYDK